MPDAIADSVVQEAERFLNADLPPNFAERLADGGINWGRET